MKFNNSNNHMMGKGDQTMDDTITVKDFVVNDYRTAAVFERHGIDFCCGGGVPLKEACERRGVNPGTLVAELRDATADADSSQIRFERWDLDLLVEHIVTVHHRYVKEAIPVILAHTRKVAHVHGERHPEVVEINSLFEVIASEMTAHMQKEELMLFPFVRALARSARDGSPTPRAPFGSIADPIHLMESEHASAGGTMERIRELSAGFQPPEDACTTYRVVFQELNEFEQDLHRHVHLENNILFPRAVVLESGLPAGVSGQDQIEGIHS